MYKCPKCGGMLNSQVIYGDLFNGAFYSLACKECRWKFQIWEEADFEVIQNDNKKIKINSLP